MSRKRTGDAASRRPEPVKLRRAGIGGTRRQGIKNTPTRQPEKAAREHGGDPSSGCGIGRRLRRRPPTSQRRPQRSRRSPELHQAARAGQTAPRRNRRHPPPRDKEHPNSPAGKGGERARRRPIFGLRNWAAPSPKTPYLAAPAAAFPPIARAPSGGPSRSNCAAPESAAPAAKG